MARWLFFPTLSSTIYCEQSDLSAFRTLGSVAGTVTFCEQSNVDQFRPLGAVSGSVTYCEQSDLSIYPRP